MVLSCLYFSCLGFLDFLNLHKLDEWFYKELLQSSWLLFWHLYFSWLELQSLLSTLMTFIYHFHYWDNIIGKAGLNLRERSNIMWSFFDLSWTPPPPLVIQNDLLMTPPSPPKRSCNIWMTFLTNLSVYGWHILLSNVL